MAEDFSQLPILGAEAPEISPTTDDLGEGLDTLPILEKPTLEQERTLSRLGSSAKRELQSLGQAAGILTALGIKGILAEGDIEVGQRLGKKPTLKEALGKTRDRFKTIGKGLAKTPEVAGEMLADFGRSFGVEVGDGQLVSSDVALDKFFDAPLETTLDWFGALGVIKKVGTTALRGAQKNAVQKAIKDSLDNDVIAELDLRRAAGEPVITDYQKLAEHRPVLNKMSMKALNSNAEGEKIGKELVDSLRKLSKEERVRLSDSIKKVSHKPVDKRQMISEIHEGFIRKGLLTEDTPIERILVDLEDKPKKLQDFLRKVDTVKDMSAGEAKRRLDLLDEAINWKNPGPKDDALIITRRAVRNQLRGVSPEYDKLASTVSEKLDLLDETGRRLDKLGLGEKKGLTIFKTDEESRALIELLETHPIKGTPGLVSSALKRRQAWLEWNQYFSGLPLEVGRVPVGPVALSPAGLIRTTKEAAIKTRLKGPISQPIRKSLIGGRAALETRERE